MTNRRRITFRSVLILTTAITGSLSAAEPSLDRLQPLETEFDQSIKPLLSTYCNDCHSGDDAEAEIDFVTFVGVNDVRQQTKLWQNVDHVVRSGQMPPKDSSQPSDAEREQLLVWLRSFLMAEAAKNAGDPGPVVLRRLSNAEYTYTIRDLTGVEPLDPARQFPVDGAAGEGFTNTGDALAMSPAMVQKYLAAAKEIASHAVLLPDGIRFSPYDNERDWTDETLAEIQDFYGQRTTTDGGTKVEFHGLTFDTDQGGRIPLEEYLKATLVYRDQLSKERRGIDDVAAELDLNAKYLSILWEALASDAESASSFVMNSVRQRWRSAKVADVPQIAEEIRGWQKALWKFNTVGHIGRAGGPTVWMESQSPLLDEQEFRVELPKASAVTSPSDVTIYFAASSVGGASENRDPIAVLWQNARLERAERSPIPLQYIASLDRKITELQRESLTNIEAYLAAVRSADRDSDVSALAKVHQLDPIVLGLWLEYLDVVDPSPSKITGHYKERIENAFGHEFVRGWGTGETPFLLVSSGDDLVTIPGTAPPHSVVTHPSPTLFSAVAWQSPIAGLIDVTARVVDGHAACGNGIEYLVQHRTGNRVVELWRGTYDVGGRAEMASKRLSVRKGDVVSLAIGPRDANHLCDLTQIDMTLAQVPGANAPEGQIQTWDLAKDVTPSILAGNPHADRNGNGSVWHFLKGPVEEMFGDHSTLHVVPVGSLLSKWQAEPDRTRQADLAKRIQELALGPMPTADSDPNQLLYRHLHELVDVVDDSMLMQGLESDKRFRRSGETSEMVVSGSAVASGSTGVEFRIPARFATDASVVVTGSVHSKGGRAQLDVSMTRPPQGSDSAQPIAAKPIVVAKNDATRSELNAAFDEFRDLFPGALCYARIVPIDEVVTLTLFYRQDDDLKRLMLSDKESAELDRLWDELIRVSHEPLKYAVAFEQIREFSTQDRPDLVVAWKANIDRTSARVAAFKKQLIDEELIHVQAIVDFASLAWRRPLRQHEAERLRETYAALRDSGLSHDRAIRLTIARVLTAPAFLYRLEEPGDGTDSSPVSDHAFASRLSYFLWSSMPDESLRQVASCGELGNKDAVHQQTQRMLRDARIRRLAVHFACQWLHIRDFDQNDEKNETLYPEFEGLRGPMYEEAVQFFEGMFRKDGSILDLVWADHVFVNPVLAKHYGLEVSNSGDWEKVANVRDKGRGGVLGMGAVLASLSGASRTSPILRGNWVSETLLGERLPKPPANVPPLPESLPSGLNARQLIEQHSSNPDCAKCHERIDPYGFALEQYDAIGRIRNHPVETKAKLFDGTTINGIEGLKSYLLNERRDDVVHQFCKKLLGYALAREVKLSDEPLLAEMEKHLGENDYRFSVAVQQIIDSPQFRNIRGQDFTEATR